MDDRTPGHLLVADVGTPGDAAATNPAGTDTGAVSRDVSPPSFLRLAGHPLRWRLLRELAASDRHVRELCALIGQSQSLVSYHLGRLRAEQVVSMRRSSADRRDAYYSLELARFGALLT
jgi:DNA-binding transcriptional ArsR family regulator